MANDQAPKAPENGTSSTSQTTSTPASTRKRRVLRPAPEPTTLREQSERAQSRAAKPRRRSRIGRILTAPFRFIGRFLVRLLQPLTKFRLVRAIGYVLAPPYLRNSWRELQQVTWPDRRQTRKLTSAVILFSLIFGGIVALIDHALDKLFRMFILNQ